jgi:hypothetical protein
MFKAHKHFQHTCSYLYLYMKQFHNLFLNTHDVQCFSEYIPWKTGFQEDLI